MQALHSVRVQGMCLQQGLLESVLAISVCQGACQVPVHGCVRSYVCVRARMCVRARESVRVYARTRV